MSVRRLPSYQAARTLLAQGVHDFMVYWVGLSIEKGTLLPPRPVVGAPGWPHRAALWRLCVYPTPQLKLPVFQDKCERGCLWLGRQACKSGRAALKAAPHFSVSLWILYNLHCFILLVMQSWFLPDWVGSSSSSATKQRRRGGGGASGTQESIISFSLFPHKSKGASLGDGENDEGHI